jgi:hypothetical protein
MFCAHFIIPRSGAAMIQFYDERPADPLEAFVWFEDLFRKQFY